MNTEKDYKPALKAAGRLAEIANLVIGSNSFDLSSAIYRLDLALKAYDKEILKLEKDD